MVLWVECPQVMQAIRVRFPAEANLMFVLLLQVGRDDPGQVSLYLHIFSDSLFGNSGIGSCPDSSHPIKLDILPNVSDPDPH
jgi:hypothetical protein